MNDEAILERARRAGIAVDWIDANGWPQRVSIASLVRLLDSLAGAPPPVPRLVTATAGEPVHLPEIDDAAGELQLEDGSTRPVAIRAQRLAPIDTPGYHTLRFGGRELGVAVAPKRCFTIADFAPGERLWGLAVQIYSLKRAGDLGIGDTTGLSMLAKAAAGCGADALALSPAHSLFPDDLARIAPYSPSSRLFLNPLLIDPAAVLGEQAIENAADSGLIDWPTASANKYALLRRLYDGFRTEHPPLAASFEAFMKAGGASLDGHARFEARNGDLGYYAFLQWLADRAFARAQRAAKEAGMRIGLIADLAIGLDPGGAQVGAAPAEFLSGLSIGAPPDAFNPNGQDWGLTSFSPQALVADGFAPFIATLRANMRHAGGVRIDHAMGLTRLWLVPSGGSPRDGAYLSYPVDDLMRLLALESHRHRAIVIGEDLGTVPSDFRARCRAAGVAGMDVLWFQRHGERFLRPDEWRDDAVAMTTTHDLPTVAGWWRGADLELRRGLGTVTEHEIAQRPQERHLLWQAFAEAGVAPGPMPESWDSDPVVDAAVGFVARAPGPLTIVPLEDIMGIAEQPNLPGTIDEHPNWRRRFALPADQLLQQPAAARRARRLNERRS
ncbi:MAG: 4-alpha-glucanotransferase [Reyranella sp.]|uniref:4-alpha-glucanotransferase n=1 Tax=Reyranella sp. TaxID=1929291 RepID=UPI001AC22517|nr:4-alpha-glucanotransferase [Reyranella sp.]MBN9086523.1 4-alpha-glucanotransferase [Reyranella sp.]